MIKQQSEHDKLKEVKSVKRIMNKFVIDNLLTQLYGDDGKLRNKYIKSLPNAKSFKVIIQGKEIPLLDAGLRKSVKSHYEITAYKNKQANRYLNHQVIRLKLLVAKPFKYGTLVTKLIQRSNVWFLVHLNKVEPAGYRRVPLWIVMKLQGKLRANAADFKGNIDFRRCYIPKVTNSLQEWLDDPNRCGRPLGVPTLVGRVYLSMLNTALTIWLERVGKKQQHGYFPMKGTTTCGIEILKKINKENIYEFDLKQFFPSVQIGYVSLMLRRTNMPKAGVEYIENLNKSQPLLQREDKTDETKARENIDIAKGILNRNQGWYKPVLEFIKANGEEIGRELLMEDTGGTSIHHEYEFVQLQGALFSSISIHKGLDPHIGTSLPASTGLPQGGGISPTLSVQVLEPIFRKNDAIMYADDGIIFGKPVLESPDYEAAGIVFHPEKSQYVKKNGQGLKELKFCGLTYNGGKDELRSTTRKGKTITIPKESLEKIVNAAEGYTSETSKKKSNIGLDALNGRLGGFIQAIHYNGTYDLETTGANGEISASNNSGFKSNAKKKSCKRNSYKINLFNASTLASHGYLNKKRKR